MSGTDEAREATSYLHASTSVAAGDITFAQAWASGSGPHASINFGLRADITLNSAAAAEALIAAATEARDALAGLEGGGA